MEKNLKSYLYSCLKYNDYSRKKIYDSFLLDEMKTSLIKCNVICLNEDDKKLVTYIKKFFLKS